MKAASASIASLEIATGDFAADMAKMMDFYRHVTPKFPERYALHGS